MAKYLKLFMVALFATMTFTFTSCGDDDEPDDPSRGEIAINGVKYKLISDLMVMDGGWTSDGKGEFGFWVVDSDGATHGFMFEFTSDTKPKSGDDLTKMGLILDLSASGFDGAFGVWDPETCEYVNCKPTSGSAIVKSVKNGEMTVQFSNLKMECSGIAPITGDAVSYSYTFDGTATADF